MTRTSPPQVAFSSGELDPLLHRRFDYQRFQTGLASCKGFLPLPQGGVTRAPGTLHRGRTKGDQRCIRIPFQFAEDDALELEFTPGIMRVWRYGALVMAGASPYELATPYDANSIAALRWVQSADVIYLVDGIQPMQRLSRLALNNWTIAAQAFSTGPFRVQNLTKTRTLQASAMTGAITLTASNFVFVTQHVGSLVQMKPTDNTTIPLWTSNEPLTVGAMRRYGKNVYQLMAGTNAKTNPPIHTEGTEMVENDPITWRFVSDDTGVARITAIISTTQASATVLSAIPQACVDNPTYRWSEGAWSALYGYPSAIEIMDQRLAAAATPSEPRTVWFSTVGSFSDFTPGVEADSAFAYSITGNGTINRIINLIRGRSGLHIMALGEEFSTRSETRAQVIGPTTAVFGIDSAIGSSRARPIAPDGNPIFISRDRRRVMMIAYSLQEDANRPTNLSLPAQHLGAAGFEQIVWQSAPQPIAWIRRSSGDLVAMIYDPSEEVLGWAVVPVAGGFVEDMAVSPNADGTADVLTLVVRRVINGVTVRMVEEMAQTYGILTGAQPITDACHLYAATRFAPALPTASFALPHLAGREVFAWTDQGEFGALTVALDGSLTLPSPVSTAFIGLFDATHELVTLDIQAAANDGNTMGRQKRLVSGMGVGLHRSAQGSLQVIETDFATAPRKGTPMSLVNRQVAAALTEAYSGVVNITAPSGHAKELAIRIAPYSGAPLTITAITPIVQEAGR